MGTAKTKAFVRPDAAALEALLAHNEREPAGIVLRLAWKAGLARREIGALTWDQVDLDAALLRLPDREVPLDAETAESLRYWRERCGGFSSYVAVSYRHRTRLSPAALSQTTRLALDSAGLRELTLKDLRDDYILRQWETHDWAYVLRVSGISLGSYRTYYAQRLKSAAPAFEPEAPEEPETNEYRIWQLMQQRRRDPAGIAIWLIQQMGVQLVDAVELTWDDVDFDALTLRTRSGTVALSRGAERVLREEFARRSPRDDPHVLLSAKGRKPLTADRVSVLVREALIRGGVTDATALDLRQGQMRDLDWRRLRERLEERGSLSPREAAELLGVPENAALQRLQALERMGYLTHIGHRYYDAENTPPAERLGAVIRQYIEKNGSIGATEAAGLLNIPYRRAGYLLRKMAQSGELCSGERQGRYVLKVFD